MREEELHVASFEVILLTLINDHQSIVFSGEKRKNYRYFILSQNSGEDEHNDRAIFKLIYFKNLVHERLNRGISIDLESSLNLADEIEVKSAKQFGL